MNTITTREGTHRFDMSARVYANFPAPDSLPIPKYKYLAESKLLIGDDEA